jgi:calcium/calmodulin-dependent protein kinase I/SNF-related kinase
MEFLEHGDSNCSFSDHYEYLGMLGEGAFAKVVKARSTDTGEEVAVKVISKKSFKGGELSRLLQEAEILSRLKHKHIVKFYRVRQTDTRVLIEMEIVPGGQLR